jgi:hypothetical protein
MQVVLVYRNDVVACSRSSGLGVDDYVGEKVILQWNPLIYSEDRAGIGCVIGCLANELDFSSLKHQPHQPRHLHTLHAPHSFMNAVVHASACRWYA